jgi:hypothetical protein
VEACCRPADLSSSERTKEELAYRARTNGMSDFSAATMLLKLAIVNSRVVRSSSGGAPSQSAPPAARRETSEAGGIDSSASVLLGDASRRGADSGAAPPAWAPQASTPLLGDATEVGIYR